LQPVVTRSLYLFSFLSGAAALIYQVAWTKMLALAFGGTTLAMSAVVAGFMGGMGIGAWRYHRLDRRIGAPLATYAGLELGIAASTLLLTLVLQQMPRAVARAAPWIPDVAGADDLLRVVAVFVLLLLPSALMGATYPALCTVLIRSPRAVDLHLGRIYGLNTVGAAVGALLAGLVTVEQLGLRGSVLLANLLNLGIGLGAWRLARGQRRPAAGATAASDEALPSALPIPVLGILLAVSGFATLGYEIAWFRAIRYLVGNSTYALTTVLVVFLIGLGFGALLYRPVLRLLRPERALALCQLAIAGFALAAIGVEHHLLSDPQLRDRLSVFSAIYRVRPWEWRLATTSGLAAAILLPATLMMGLSFPLASRLFLGRVRAVGRATGAAYFLANLGSISGSIGAAFVLLPRLGTVGTIQLLSALNLLLGLLLLAFLPRARTSLALAVPASGLILAAGLSLLPPRLGFQGEEFVSRQVPALLFEEEGDLATVQVRANPMAPGRRAMTIDGAIIAVGRGVNPIIYEKQQLLGALPLSLDPSIRRTLNVGLASGSTVATMATYPALKTLDVVEINAPVARAARYFGESAVGKQNEDFSGNARILSREFYAFSYDRLSPCGIFAQWIPGSMRPQDFEIVLRTLLSVFPELEVFFSPPGSIFMLASRCPLHGRAGSPVPLPPNLELESHGFASREDLLSRWIASAAQIRSVLPPGPLNRTDRLLLEFSTYRAGPARELDVGRNLSLLLAAQAAAPSEAGAAFAPPDAASSLVSRGLQQAWAKRMSGDRSGARRLARKLAEEHPADASVRASLAMFSSPG
jgi:spermidine synthase